MRRQQSLSGFAHRVYRLATDERRRNRYGVGFPMRVSEKINQFARFLGRPVPDHVVAPMPRPQIVVLAGDRIAENLLARRQAKRHGVENVGMRAMRQCVFGNGARQAT